MGKDTQSHMPRLWNIRTAEKKPQLETYHDGVHTCCKDRSREDFLFQLLAQHHPVKQRRLLGSNPSGVLVSKGLVQFVSFPQSLEASFSLHLGKLRDYAHG